MTFVPVAVDLRNGVIDGEVAHTMQAKPNGGQSLNTTPAVLTDSLSLSRLASSSAMQDVASTVTTGTGQRMDPDTESLVVT